MQKHVVILRTARTRLGYLLLKYLNFHHSEGRSISTHRRPIGFVVTGALLICDVLEILIGGLGEGMLFAIGSHTGLYIYDKIFIFTLRYGYRTETQ